MKTCPLCDAAWPSTQATCPTDGALLIESRDLDPGTVIRGKYRIERLLGRGGMGTVYLAEHILLSRLRALKFISTDLSQDPRFLKRFRHEAQAASELHHPNVVQVLDLDQAEDGSPYIAMEYVEGQDLRHALADGAFPVERALTIARGIAQGLAAAHTKGIVHRDIKPENILLTGSNETPKLLDFGIAAMRETGTAISRTHGLLLTPQYAAPEQWKGLPAEEIDGRADLYALGCVLYEMLTGQTPFQAHNTEGWMYQHLQEPPRPPSQLRPELANWQGLDTLVLRLLAKDREQRPKDAAELLSLFDAVSRIAPVAVRVTAREEPPFAVRRGGVSKNAKTSRRVPLIWGGLALLATALALAAFVVWHFFGYQKSSQTEVSTNQAPSVSPSVPGDWTVLASAPSTWPVEGKIASTFGEREDPHTGKAEFHTGIDIAAPYGSPVLATGGGEVSDESMGPGYGRQVVLSHGHDLLTVYGNLSATSVLPRQRVSRGQIIGYVGQSAQSEGSAGPHLHYEVRVHNVPVNPERYLPSTSKQVANPNSADATPEVEQSVRESISAWEEAFRSRDSTKLAESYAPMVEKYFLKENVSREQIRRYIQSDFAHMEDIHIYEIDNVKIEMVPSENNADGGTSTSAAAAIFHKAWETTQTDGKTFSGEEIEKLTFVSSPEGWKIIREEELNIIRASKR